MAVKWLSELNPVRTGAATRASIRGREGQSILELLLMFPMMMGLAIVLIKVNTVIQFSIVNQQYARAQTLWLAFNHAWYPKTDKREPFFAQRGYNRMIVGVAENAAPEPDEPYVPEVSKHMIARTRALAGGEGSTQEEPAQRGFVHVRTTVAMCTPSTFVGSGSSRQSITVPKVAKAGVSRDPFDPKSFSYCVSPLDE